MHACVSYAMSNLYPAMVVEQVVDTTGAGDCFTGAYAVALLEGQPPQAALRFAGDLHVVALAYKKDSRNTQECENKARGWAESSLL